MRGLYLMGSGTLALRETPIPALQADMVRIAVRFAGVCSTDIGYWKNGSEKLKLPIILGHEMSGVVEATGAAVERFSVGDRVIVTNDYYLCGTCRYCRSGDTNMCLNRRSIGSAEDGAFADYMTVPEKMVLPLPDTISFEEGALTEVAACCVHALRQQNAGEGSLVLVMGPGIMGMTTALAARAMGCRVILVGLSRDQERLSIAKNSGVPHVIDAETADLSALVREESNGYGADITCECTGSFGGLAQCFAQTARRGSVVQIAIPHGAHGIDLSPVIKKELRYAGSYAKNNADWAATLQLMAEGKLNCKPLISTILPLEDYRQAFELVGEAKGLKVLFDMDR